MLHKKLIMICTTALWSAIGAAAPTSSAADLHFVTDCSGCPAEQKRAQALGVLEADLPLPDSSGLLVDIDVTDFENREIDRFRLVFAADREDRGGAVPVPAATIRNFSTASDLIDAMGFMPAGTDFRQADPVPVDYPSALDLLGDNGYEAGKLSDAVNGAYIPGGKFGSLQFARTLKPVLPLAADFLDNANLVVRALDGTLVIVEGTLLTGANGQVVVWEVAEDGLRRADGTAIADPPVASAGK